MDSLLKKPPSTETSSTDQNSPASTAMDTYRILRGQIEHEDNLIGSRISWFVTSQSFLFSAYAIIAGGIQPNTSKTALDSKHVLLVVVPAMAIVTSILILISILSGFEAMRLIRKRCAEFLPPAEHRQLPLLQGSRRTRLGGMAAPVLLPPLFMGVWIFLLVRRLF